MTRRTGGRSRPRSKKRRRRSRTVSGTKADLAGQLSARDPFDVLRHYCRQDGIDVDAGSLTTRLESLKGDGGGFYWARRHSALEQLLLSRIARVAWCLGQARQANGDSQGPGMARKTALHLGRVSFEEAEQPGDGSVCAWLTQTATELFELANRAKHGLAALAEKEEQRRQVAKLRGGPHSGTPTRAVLEHLRRQYGPVSDDEALRELLRDVDLHLLAPPWDHLDRAVLGDDLKLLVKSRHRGEGPWEVGFPRVRRVARDVGLLSSGDEEVED